jgi:hypothetical protein
MPFLFSYGTLQLPAVQQSTFGRLLHGQVDEIAGYEHSLIKLNDPAFVAATGITHYTNIIFNGKLASRVSGIAYEVTDIELFSADRYERDAGYQRTLVALASGKQAWVYAVPTPESERD